MPSPSVSGLPGKVASPLSPSSPGASSSRPRKKVEVLELNVQPDHVHAVLQIPPRLSVSEVVGTLKGKTAIKVFKSYPGLKKKPYWGNHFWARGYCVTTIGMDEDKIRRYVKYQEENEKRQEGDERDFGLF
jgi:putative transposase